MCVCVCVCVCGYKIIFMIYASSAGFSSSSPSSSLIVNYFFLRAFEKYDCDGDGLISVQDLQQAFAAQGRSSTASELVAWVRKRDLSNLGAVCLEDFVRSYR